MASHKTNERAKQDKTGGKERDGIKKEDNRGMLPPPAEYRESILEQRGARAVGKKKEKSATATPLADKRPNHRAASGR